MNHSNPITLDAKGRIVPTAGMMIQADEWKMHFIAELRDDDGYSDDEFAGCQFRYFTAKREDTYDIATNIKVTGKPKYFEAGFRSRIKIEWVQDGNQPSIFGGGWIYWGGELR